MNLDLLSDIPPYSQILIVLSLLLFISSISLFVLHKKGFLFTLFGAAICLASAFAISTSWLYIWDEQFHALVAKHLSVNPFHPILIKLDPSLLRNENWADQHTWLHKQPLFLYQMAMSIKLFGNSAFAVRLPSILLHAVGVISLYDIGKILFSKKIGLFAAILLMFSLYPLGMLTGRLSTDHNDSVFMVYVLLSFWAFFRYRVTQNKKWVNWIGIFVGLAILTKWVVGLLVFAPWGVIVLSEMKKKQFSELYCFLRALIIAILIALPWQLYIHTYFPKEANYELAYNARHFFEAIEGHRGDWAFHFTNLHSTFFSIWFLVPLLALSIYFAFRKKVDWKVYSSLWIATLVLFLFFSIAKTKMASFVMPVYPLVLILVSFALVSLIDTIKTSTIRKVTYLISGFVMVIIIWRPTVALEDSGFNQDSDFHGSRNLYQQQKDFILKHGSDDKKTVVLNAELRGHGNISWMFFTENQSVSYIPEAKQIELLKRKGYNLKCIQWKDSLPKYIREDKSIELLLFE